MTGLIIGVTVLLTLPLGLVIGWGAASAQPNPAAAHQPTTQPVEVEDIEVVEGWPESIPLADGTVVYSGSYEDTSAQAQCPEAPTETFLTTSVEVKSNHPLPAITGQLIDSGNWQGTAAAPDDESTFLSAANEKTQTVNTATGTNWVEPHILQISTVNYYDRSIVSYTYGPGNLTCLSV